MRFNSHKNIAKDFLIGLTVIITAPVWFPIGLIGAVGEWFRKEYL